MTSRERIRAAINHRRPDRVPIDLGATFVSGITVDAYSRLRDHIMGQQGPINVIEPMQVLAEVELPVLERLGVDVVGVFPGGGRLHGWRDWTMPNGTLTRMQADVDVKPRGDGGWDLFYQGKHLYTMPPGGMYFDPVEYPKWRTQDRDIPTDELLENLQSQARHWRTQTDYAVVLNTPSYSFFNGTNPEFLCALLVEKDEVHERLEIWADNILAGLAPMLDAAKDFCDIVAFGADLGTQKAPLIGPDLYREMILPHFRRVTEFVHDNSDLKIFYHTCGSVYELIECLIELGIDILNPLQLSAANMEPDRLVREFGGRIVFWGGGCDTQQVLPHATTDEVRREVRSRIDAYSTIPGYVFNPVHNIQPDVSAENMLAMFDEAQQ